MDNRRIGLADANIIRKGDYGIYNLYGQESGSNHNLKRILGASIPAGILIIGAKVAAILHYKRKKRA